MKRREFLRKSSKIVIGSGLLVAAARLPTRACSNEVITTTTHGLDFENFDVITWRSGDFVGTTRRIIRENPPYLRFELDASEGGTDVALRAKQPLNDMSSPTFLASGYSMGATYGVTDLTAEVGEWWCGLKFEINNGGVFPPGRFECYIVEKSNRTQAAWEAGLTGTPETAFIGTTEHDGGTYSHYTREKTDGATTWTQIFAIRDVYRDSGITSVIPVFQHWLTATIPAGLPMGYPRFIIEHEGPGERIFELSDLSWPSSITA